MRNRIIVVAALILAAFLGGFVPQYSRAVRLESELEQARQDRDLAQLRDLISMAYFQATQRNYGLAAGASTEYFNRVREVSAQTSDPAAKKQLEEISSLRDKVTSLLARGDAAVMSDLQNLFQKTREVRLPK